MPYDSMMTRWQVAHIFNGREAWAACTESPSAIMPDPYPCPLWRKADTGTIRTKSLGADHATMCLCGVGSSLARWFSCW
jgi:hypothetical protein